AWAGIYADSNEGATGLTVSNSTIYGTNSYGILLAQTNDGATITGNTMYGVPGGAFTDNQQVAILLLSSNHVISGNTIYDNGQTGVKLDAQGPNVITNNLVYGNVTGIDAYYSAPATISNNTVHDNTTTGIFAGASLVVGNIVYGQTAVPTYPYTGGIGIRSS